jgi:ABC-type dipeptide/oligopeptide/nickel transport system permease subunit
MNIKVFFRRMRKSRLFNIGFFSILAIGVICFALPYFIKHDPLGVDLTLRLKAPNWSLNGVSGYFFGTDMLGRDVLSRLLVGGRLSLTIATSVVIITTIVGLVFGLIAGYYGGIPDLILMRICDILMAVPGLLLALCVVAILGGNVFNLVVILSLTAWVILARVVRSTVLSIRGLEYIRAAKVLGMPDYKVIFSEVLPNVVGPVIITATQAFGGMILAEAAMSYLGLGVPPPNPSWGSMISDGRAYIASSPWVVLVPGIALMLTVLAVNFLGDGLNDILNPKNLD